MFELTHVCEELNNVYCHSPLVIDRQEDNTESSMASVVWPWKPITRGGRSYRGKESFWHSMATTLQIAQLKSWNLSRVSSRERSHSQRRGHSRPQRCDNPSLPFNGDNDRYRSAHERFFSSAHRNSSSARGLGRQRKDGFLRQRCHYSRSKSLCLVCLNVSSVPVSHSLPPCGGRKVQYGVSIIRMAPRAREEKRRVLNRTMSILLAFNGDDNKDWWNEEENPAKAFSSWSVQSLSSWPVNTKTQ